jgi:hypothetical protein
LAILVYSLSRLNQSMPTRHRGHWVNRIIHGDNLEALKSLLPEFEVR